ncbi:MAG: hypothetical protein ACLGI8_10455 [Acidimicrobiia bacterium]|jgi:predicted DNA-binding protein YlxM (UPF0122 family)
MRTNRKLVGAAAFSLALAGGGVAGAMLGTPTLSLAQDDGAAEGAETPMGPRGFGHHDRGAHLETVAEVIGISVEDLRAALADGQSIAEVAEANGVDRQDVVDALVEEAMARLDEIEAALPDRMGDLVDREGWGDGPRVGLHLAAEGLDVAADVIGIGEAELLAALRDGATLAEVAEANGVAPQAVIDALVAAATEAIDAAVEAGDLDADRAAALKEGLVERITERVEDGGPGPGAGHGRGHRPGGPGPWGEGPMAEEDDAA